MQACNVSRQICLTQYYLFVTHISNLNFSAEEQAGSSSYFWLVMNSYLHCCLNIFLTVEVDKIFNICYFFNSLSI